MTELDTLGELIAIDSVNPEWGGPGELEMVRYVSDFLTQADVETWTREILPGRPNLYARLPGRDPSRRIVLEAHLDTVSCHAMDIAPHEPVIENGRMFGRGSCDVKAGLAAMLHALRDLRFQGQQPSCDVWLAAVIDEEHRYRGVLGLLQELQLLPQVQTLAAVVAEPTDCRIAIANKGVLRWRIHTRGKAAHSSRPNLGHNAIEDMLAVVSALKADQPRLEHKQNPWVGSPTLCVSQISGGRQVNFVPDNCTIAIDRRLIPDESAQEELAYYERLVGQLPGVQAQFETPSIVDEAMHTPSDSCAVSNAQRAAAATGLDPTPCGVAFGCDATKLHRAGIPSLIFGPGSIDQAHAAVEFVDTEQVTQAKRFYQSYIEGFVQ